MVSRRWEWLRPAVARWCLRQVDQCSSVLGLGAGGTGIVPMSRWISGTVRSIGVRLWAARLGLRVGREGQREQEASGYPPAWIIPA